MRKEARNEIVMSGGRKEGRNIRKKEKRKKTKRKREKNETEQGRRKGIKDKETNEE